MAEKGINTKKENKFIIRATPRAYEKLKEIVNGSKEKVNEFINNITKNGIKKEDYYVFLKDISGEFYFHKCKNVYVIFVIGTNEITLVDFLTEIEFNEIRNKQN